MNMTGKGRGLVLTFLLCTHFHRGDGLGSLTCLPSNRPWSLGDDSQREKGGAGPPRAFLLREDPADHVEMGECRQWLVDGDGELDAVGVGPKHVESIDVDPGIGEESRQPGELTRPVRKLHCEDRVLFEVQVGLLEDPTGGGRVAGDEADGPLTVVTVCGQRFDVHAECSQSLRERCQPARLVLHVDDELIHVPF